MTTNEIAKIMFPNKEYKDLTREERDQAFEEYLKTRPGMKRVSFKDIKKK